MDAIDSAHRSRPSAISPRSASPCCSPRSAGEPVQVTNGRPVVWMPEFINSKSSNRSPLGRRDDPVEPWRFHTSTLLTDLRCARRQGESRRGAPELVEVDLPKIDRIEGPALDVVLEHGDPGRLRHVDRGWVLGEDLLQPGDGLLVLLGGRRVTRRVEQRVDLLIAVV